MAGVGQLLLQPAAQPREADHHQAVAQRANLGAQAKRRRVGKAQKAVGQHRVFTQPLLNGLHGVVSVKGFHQVGHGTVSCLHLLLAVAVHHVFCWPARHGPDLLFVQRVLDQRPAGQAFVNVRGLQGAGRQMGR